MNALDRPTWRGEEITVEPTVPGVHGFGVIVDGMWRGPQRDDFGGPA